MTWNAALFQLLSSSLAPKKQLDAYTPWNLSQTLLPIPLAQAVSLQVVLAFAPLVPSWFACVAHLPCFLYNKSPPIPREYLYLWTRPIVRRFLAFFGNLALLMLGRDRICTSRLPVVVL